MTMWIILAVASVVVVFVIVAYNGFVTLTQRTKEAWADIDVQLKRRYDLIPNLIETVKGYAAHERETFDAVVAARAAATQVHVDPTNITSEQISAMAGAEDALGGALGKLMMIAEAYPDLKANENFLQLQNELVDTEDKIQASRRFYNGGVRDLNTKIQVFPNNVFAGMLGFSERDFFEVEDMASVENPVEVKF